MEAGGSTVVAMKKAALTPKAIIYQRFGNKASYKVEEVHESAQNECPGLAIVQKGPCLYRCALQLPDIFVVSGIFKKKKEAEQSAAELALEKLGIDPTSSNLTQEDSWEALIGRVKYLFSDEFLTSFHPLSGHFRAALQRECDHYGCAPVSVITSLDTKLSSLSKLIDPKVESNPYMVLSYVMKAAAQLSGILKASEEQLWIRRQDPYPPEILDSASEQSSSSEHVLVEAVYIPCLPEKNIYVVNLRISSKGYYLDAIAEQLGVGNASKLLITRPIGKASSEARLYFPILESYLSEFSSDLLNAESSVHSERSFNARASYLSCEDIYGDAIFASIGYTWKSKDLFHENVNIQSYYRMLLNKVPSGIYRLSRGSILTADLPVAFTTRANWRGSLPRDILCTFCRQHRLSEPVFSTFEAPSEQSGSHKKLKVMDSAAEETHVSNGCLVSNGVKEVVNSVGTFRCEVKICSKFQDLIIECSPKRSYKKQSESIHNASLKVLLWLDAYFKKLDVPKEKLESTASELDIKFNHQNFLKAFSLCQNVRFFQYNDSEEGKYRHSKAMLGLEKCSLQIDGPESAVSPSNGSISCISYTVMLVNRSDNVQQVLESNEEFEYEVGSGSVISQLEAAVTQMTVGQSAFLCMDLPCQDFILAAGDDSERILSLLSSEECILRYTLTLLHITEPMEDRMEQALFSPPLSKQRVEYALQHIKQSRATSLVDFGCGSGSLLDSLLNYQSSLEKMVGVDLSQKSLIRAAKVLHSKLNTNMQIKSAILYDGSITDFDSRLYGFDIGTCLEVIEHMEEDQAWLFGDVVLTDFCPKILIVSTPNYEYNVILQRSNISSQEEDPDDKTQSQACKFRNHDHKFEWTREQFKQWATELATKHNYSVEFSGVGGSGHLELGFASQIAVFRRGMGSDSADSLPKAVDLELRYDILWEWNSSYKS